MRIDSTICRENIALGIEVRDFIQNVPGAKEESITDYLMWKWRALDSRFKFMRTIPFTRHQEGTTTGADFELELWLVGRTIGIPLLFQAKKFVPLFDAYVSKLNYPNNTQHQLQTLLSYASARQVGPFYAIYTTHVGTQLMCGAGQSQNTGIYMIDAFTAKRFADGQYGKRVSLDSILERSNPFHCMFCCPLRASNGYLGRYFNLDHRVVRERIALPRYVEALLSDGARAADDGPTLDRELPSTRFIGVYDLADVD